MKTTEAVRAEFSIAVRATPAGAKPAGDRTIEFVASTDGVDRYGEIVAQDWNLDAFQKNPVFLWAHKRDELPIGSVDATKIESGKLIARVRFAGADVNPRAEQVYQAYKQGFMRAVSVGFMPSDARVELHDGVEVFVLSGNELRELSAVPVPGNADALMLDADRPKQRERIRTMAVRWADLTNAEKVVMFANDRARAEALRGAKASVPRLKRWEDYKRPIDLDRLSREHPDHFAKLLEDRNQRRAQ